MNKRTKWLEGLSKGDVVKIHMMSGEGSMGHGFGTITKTAPTHVTAVTQGGYFPFKFARSTGCTRGDRWWYELRPLTARDDAHYVALERVRKIRGLVDSAAFERWARHNPYVASRVEALLRDVEHKRRRTK